MLHIFKAAQIICRCLVVKIQKVKNILWVIVTIISCAMYILWNSILSLDDFNCQDNLCDTKNANNELSLASLETNAEMTNGTLPKGLYLYINLDELNMYVYKDGNLLKTYPVSGGKPSTPSPLGSWKVTSKAEWGEGFGGAWMGFNVPWGKYGIHGTMYPWFIGKSNASKGCIRMKNEDVSALYKLVTYGATIKIVHENYVFRILHSGDIGSDVLGFQKSLKKLGYYQGSLNGKYGDNLKAAVTKFQKENKLQQSGSITRQTRNMILDFENIE